MTDEKTKQFYRDLRILKKEFIEKVGALVVKYGLNIVPLSFEDVFNFWNPLLDKLIDKDFRHKIERKIKDAQKKLNPFWRKLRKFWGID